MLRRSFLAALGLAPAALIPAKDDRPIIRGVTFEGTISCTTPGVRIENCTSINPEANGFRIVDPARA